MFRPRGLPAVAGLAIRSVPRARIVSVARRLQSTAELPKTTSVPPTPPPPPPPKKAGGWRRLFRYTYRLIYITTFGGVVYFGYSN